VTLFDSNGIEKEGRI